MFLIAIYLGVLLSFIYFMIISKGAIRIFLAIYIVVLVWFFAFILLSVAWMEG